MRRLPVDRFAFLINFPLFFGPLLGVFTAVLFLYGSAACFCHKLAAFFGFEMLV